MLSQNNLKNLNRKSMIHFVFPRIIPLIPLILLYLVSCGVVPQGEQETGTLILSVSSPYGAKTLLLPRPLQSARIGAIFPHIIFGFHLH